MGILPLTLTGTRIGNQATQMKHSVPAPEIQAR